MYYTDFLFQSTRPSRGETSSHAEARLTVIISIHSPLAGRDHRSSDSKRLDGLFQSTRPSRGETSEDDLLVGGGDDFNPLAPRGARRQPVGAVTFSSLFQSTRPSRGETQPQGHQARSPEISIHSPLAGRDIVQQWEDEYNRFQSTRPSRGETTADANVLETVKFQSTRPSRGETGGAQVIARDFRHFNPLAPRGARRLRPKSISTRPQFQSTRPSRGETVFVEGYGFYGDISIHSPLAGRDSKIAQNHARDYCNSHNQPLEHG